MKLVLLIFATVIMQSAVLGNTFIGLVATQENSKDELPLPCMIMMPAHCLCPSENCHLQLHRKLLPIAKESM